jgi:hypothetical protein
MVQFIQDTECIGDSLVKINSNFSNLSTHGQVLSATKFDKVGGSVTGAITLPSNPTAPLHAATKQYVDSFLPKASVTFTGKVSNGALCSIVTSSNILSVRKIGNPGLYKISFAAPLLFRNVVGTPVVRADLDATAFWVCGSGYKPATVALASGYVVENYTNGSTITAIDIQTFNSAPNPTGISYRDVDTLTLTFE